MPEFRDRTFRFNQIFRIAATAAFAIALSACLGGTPSAFLQQRNALTGSGVAVYAAGDIADCRDFGPERSAAARTAALVAARLADDPGAVVLTLGDNTYPAGNPREFAGCYEPTWGRFKARTYPSPGNHDYYTPQAAGYYGYFGDAAGPARRGYYSFDLGGWHLISLNSYLQPGQHKDQLRWLKADLRQSKARCTLAYWHHPRFSSGGHGDSERMADAWAMLQAAGVDIVLAGHDHDYERFAPLDANGVRNDKHGMRQFVVGTGGARLTPFRFHRSNSETSTNLTHGVLKLVLKDNGYEWEFLPVENNAFADRGAALCH